MGGQGLRAEITKGYVGRDGAMGGLFSSGNKVPTKAIILFEDPSANATPTNGPQSDVCARLTQLLEQGNGFVDKLSTFESAQDLRREAMQSPQDQELQSRAFDAILPNVQFTADVFQFASTLQDIAPTMVDMCRLLAQPGSSASGPDWVGTSLPLIKRLTDMLELCLRFDLVKMRCPELLNTFAYYRRNLNKFPDRSIVSEQLTTQISMFMATANPMITGLCQAIGTAEDIKKILGNLANICCSMVMGSHCEIREDTTQYALRVMTVSIVLYDHLVPTGVFRKASIVEMKKCIVQVRDKSDQAADLLNTLRFSTKNYKTCPAKLAQLIEDACAQTQQQATPVGESKS